MQPKNTLKFIVTLVVVGFFGSLVLSGPSTSNLAQLPAPQALLGAASLAVNQNAGNLGNQVNVVGRSALNPVQFSTAADVIVNYNVPTAADGIIVTVSGVTDGVVDRSPLFSFYNSDGNVEIPINNRSLMTVSHVFAITTASCLDVDTK